MPTLEALATATPDNRVRQERVRALVEALVDERAPEHRDRLSVFDSAGVDARGLAKPFDWYLSEPGWPERSQAFEAASAELAERVAREALDEASLVPEAVDAVVFATTSGVATPNIDTHLANRLDLPAEVTRVPVWGLGCAGGVAGLARAGDLARANPDERVLFVSLELCSLAFLQEELNAKALIAYALFGDGAAATLVAGDELDAGGPRVGATRSHLWPGSQDVMGWTVEDRGLSVVMSPRIPEIVESRLPEVAQGFLKAEGSRLDEVRAVLHPGGPKVLAAFGDGLALDEHELAPARQVLRDNGNMSSPTVLFTLERVLEREALQPGERAMLAAVGPGFAAELALLEGAR